jgi:superfamily II DNA helicase RecQ
MAALRAWRLERARADAVPPYVIAHDSTLAAIAERRPGSPAELRRVPGIGPAKIEKYGTEILAVVARAGRSARGSC